MTHELRDDDSELLPRLKSQKPPEALLPLGITHNPPEWVGLFSKPKRIRRDITRCFYESIHKERLCLRSQSGETLVAFSLFLCNCWKCLRSSPDPSVQSQKNAVSYHALLLREHPKWLCASTLDVTFAACSSCSC